MTQQPNQYHSYLLRLWRSNAQSPWRSSVQCTASGEKQIFADLAALFNFIHTQLAEEASAGEAETAEKRSRYPKVDGAT